MHLVIAASWLDPIANLLSSIIVVINAGVHNPGLSLVILAALIRLIFWPLNTAQFKSMLGMQKIAPKIKKLQERYKNDPQKMQAETMALYKTEGVNPLSGCWPTLVQLPILFSVYWAVINHKDLFNTPFLWIGSMFSVHPPLVFGEPLIAASLAHPDVLLIVAYMVSQYVAMRFTTMPPTDPAQASQLKMMQVLSPVMIGFFGFRAQWPSAMVLYWLSYNLFTMGQQFYLLKRYHTPLSAIDSEHAIVENIPDEPAPSKKKLPNAGGAAKTYKVKKKTKGAQS